MLFLDLVVIGWQGRGCNCGGINGAGIEMAGLFIEFVEGGREEVAKWLGEGGRTSGGEEV